MPRLLVEQCLIKWTRLELLSRVCAQASAYGRHRNIATNKWTRLAIRVYVRDAFLQFLRLSSAGLGDPSIGPVCRCNPGSPLRYE